MDTRYRKPTAAPTNTPVTMDQGPVWSPAIDRVAEPGEDQHQTDERERKSPRFLCTTMGALIQKCTRRIINSGLPDRKKRYSVFI